MTFLSNNFSANKGRIVAIARDVGNPSFQDIYFPIVRNKDFYVGISWATGVVGGLRQAESSTEVDSKQTSFTK